MATYEIKYPGMHPDTVTIWKRINKLLFDLEVPNVYGDIEFVEFLFPLVFTGSKKPYSLSTDALESVVKWAKKNPDELVKQRTLWLLTR